MIYNFSFIEDIMRTSILTLNPVPVKGYDLVYIADRINNTWKFNGYGCHRCGRIIKNDSTIEKHTINCYKGGYQHKKEPEPDPYIVNVYGEQWQSYRVIDMLQNNNEGNNTEVEGHGKGMEPGIP
jgi:hypothetical protein